MKDSNLRAPRTLADCQWDIGGSANRHLSDRAEAGYGIVLAIVIGIVLSVVLFFGWSK